MESFQGQHKISAEERFWPKVAVGTPEECWEYKAYKNNKGYGTFAVNGRSVLAHRFAYESYHKCKIPLGKQILHHCDNPTCCNPSHLYCGTNMDNMHDKAIRGRIDPRKYCGLAKLHDEDVKLIKKLYWKDGISQDGIAKILKIGQSTVSRHIRGESKNTKGTQNA